MVSGIVFLSGGADGDGGGTVVDNSHLVALTLCGHT